jgi:hypothetical protein
VHRRHFVATGCVLAALAAVAGRRVVFHEHDRAVARLTRGRRRHADDAVGARADVAHRSAHAAVLPHHLDRAVAEGERAHAPRRLHVELLRDAADVLAVGAELTRVAELRPDVLAFAQRLVVGGEHHAARATAPAAESAAIGARCASASANGAIVAHEPRHRFGRRRRRSRSAGMRTLVAVRGVEQLVGRGDALAQFLVVDGFLRVPVHDLVAAVEGDLVVAVLVHVRVELRLQFGRREDVGADECRRTFFCTFTVLPRGLATPLSSYSSGGTPSSSLDFDRIVVFEEVDDVVVEVERAIRILGVDANARITRDHELERWARPDVRQGSVGGAPSPSFQPEALRLGAV